MSFLLRRRKFYSGVISQVWVNCRVSHRWQILPFTNGPCAGSATRACFHHHSLESWTLPQLQQSTNRLLHSQLVSLSRVEGQTKYYMQLEEHQPTQDDHNEPSQDPIDEGYESSSHQYFDLPLGSSGCTLLCAQLYIHGNPGRGYSSMPSSSIRDLIRVCFLSMVSLSTLCSFR